LSQSKAAHGARDFDDQAGLNFELLGFRQPQVRKDVAGAEFCFDTIKNALCYLESP
jgi:hypothetical protein